MACYHPIPAAQDRDGARVRLWPQKGTASLALPCGTCLGCRTEYASQWAERCNHETSLYEHNAFITLTYDDKHLPEEGHLDAASLQRFFKRLRKRAGKDSRGIATDRGRNIRYFACGEYGERNGRPHYHSLTFNADFADKRHTGFNEYGEPLYESDTLSELWPFGNHVIGAATPRSAAYIAQYSLKKQGVKKGGQVDAETGWWRPAPFLRMSLKPAIGTEWLCRYHADLTHGYLVSGGRRRAIPRMYLRKLDQYEKKQQGPAKYSGILDEIQTRRANHLRTILHEDMNDPERRAATETIHKQTKERKGGRY